ncbi:aldehyde dehydrogenase (NADP(+)) [Aquirufa antheringensis]|jgi:NADP-dependent aldehyde dehydrogenase|uniref:Aldehyde dehydrogenase (NADP(+)) n=1 Tax=Aquirufa antheringensis TaxID=2516559 RepID=A0A4Q9B9D9_9BACT|nr:aldehyde dehydrogenase (NADP(+)) [Aquirufa antheringensis]MCZ2485686.1 aldehyde dehydrogenase (NADP(+)) [Aquirufa antheringensis]MCZ2486621.1 aldehyde dehydrogenase (NADP(+)) [Aquirufa antheringensis]MCZ2488598.1 aldehyde dehydrogenase (NADP(+)) [Aquirufa antheringensis]TBH71837.1 aldehyde dehydrogenase (NADP(+)) [Aquirufa antheringensis]
MNYTDASIAEIDSAIAAAKAAFPIYRRISDVNRAAFLEAISREIMALGDELIQSACAESNLPEARITGERGRTTGQIQAFADFISNPVWKKEIHDPAQPDRAPLPKPDLFQTQIPLGPVAVFGASNFPLAFSVAGGDTISALAAGCPVVFKAHPAHPKTGELVGSAISKAVASCGLPAGVFALIHGSSNEVGSHLVQHPAIQAVGFTGSYRGGKALYDLAVRRPYPIPVYAEMGSVNPVILLSNKIAENPAALAAGLAGSVCLGVGQFCTNPGLIILQKKDASFLDLLATELDKLPLGTFLTPGIAAAYTSGVANLAKHAKKLTSRELPSPALFVADAATANHAILEEVFGPCTVAILVEDESELLTFIESMDGQLTGTIHGTKAEISEELVDALLQKVGRLLFNGFPTGVEVSGAMVHGGPFPATTDSRSTSVGTQAIYRFMRMVCLQNRL